MLNLDHHDQNSNNSLLQSDWHKSHSLSLDAADPTVLSLNPSHTHFPRDHLTGLPHSIDPVTPADAADLNSGPLNPSPETPGELLGAPNDNESSSSLTPAPSPENGRTLNKDTQPEGKDAIGVDSRNRQSPTSGRLASHSRQSSPLTDPSNPNTPPRGKEGEASNADRAGSNENRENSELASSSNLESVASKSSDGERRDSSGGGRTKAGDSQMDGFDTHPLSGGSASAQPANGTSISSVIDTSPDHLSNSSTLKAPGEPPDEKASAILQLNAELLKVCMDFQTRSLIQSPEFNAYISRLQSNLTWLAAAADREKNKQHMALPNMSPPPATPFHSMHTINELYERLPKLFAKEIARRQKEVIQGHIAGVKRGPDPATDSSNGMRKRVDTGERRQSNPPGSMAGSPPHARSPSVMSNGPVNAPVASNVNIVPSTGLNHVEPPLPQAQPIGAMSLGMGLQTVPSQQQQLSARVPSEAMSMGTQQGLPPGMPEGQRQRQPSQLRPMPPKNPQSIPPPPAATAGLSNGMNNPMPGPVPSNTRPNMMQLVFNNFGQVGVQNYTALQQGLNNAFVQYMVQNVPNFMQMSPEQQLQRMAVAQQTLRQQRMNAAANMNGLPGQQLLPDQSFGRQGSPPSVNPLQPQHSGQGIPHVSPPPQVPSVGFGSVNGVGVGMGMQQGMQPGMQQGMQPGMQPRSNAMAAGQNMSGVAIPGAGLSFNSMAAQQRQLLLIQQQMHQRNPDGVVNAQQAYAAAQEKIRMEQQSRMSNHQQHTPPNSAGSPPHTGHGGMGTPVPGITGIQSPTNMMSGTPGMGQKQLSGQMDAYQMALFNQAQQRGNMNMRPGTAMGMRPTTAMGMTPPINPQHQQQQRQQQAAQFAANGGGGGGGGGGMNPMMYGGGNGMNMTQQNWQSPTSQHQQQFHSISPAALQHHPDAGTPRPGSSASNNPMMTMEGMNDGSFDSLFNWGGT